ncbi:hypothetical protein HOY80DRAFT_952820 [Tuber brumale]|nr:hypothetical protein HOY80DRAFT_952820 [Tuber brumale]
MDIRNEGVYTYPFEREKTASCPVCGKLATYFTVDPEWSLEVFMDKLKLQAEVYVSVASISSVINTDPLNTIG